MTKMAAMPIYGKNHKKIFFSGTGGPILTKLCMKHLGLWPIIVYINHDLWLTLTIFTASSILVTQEWKNVKTLNFSGSFAACDLKVGRYRQHVELMKCCEYQRSRSFLDLGQRSFTN